MPKLVQAGVPGEPGAQARFTGGPSSAPSLLLRGHCAGGGQIPGQAALTPPYRHRLCEVLVRVTAEHTPGRQPPQAQPQTDLLCATAAAVGAGRSIQGQRQVSRLTQPSLHPGPGSSSYLLSPARRHQLTQCLPSRCAPSTCPVPGRPGLTGATGSGHTGAAPRRRPEGVSPSPTPGLSGG